VTLAHRYLAGVAVVAAGGVALVAAVSPGDRAVVGWGAVVGLILQTPLGWWALRSVGTEGFMAIWGLGMLVRLTVVVIAGSVVLPVLGRDAAGPMLGTMVGVLVALLLVEGVTALQEHSREDER
jgi:heme A synthase